MKASIATVKFGPLEFEGLMLEDGTFAVAIPQLAALNLVPKNRSLKELEALLGMVFPSPKKVKTELHPKSVNCISILDFEQVLRTLNRRGLEAAVDIVDNMLGLSLVQLFSDAFGVKFDEEDRQAWFLTRVAGKAVRRTLTDATKLYCDTSSVSDGYKTFIYSNMSDAINKGVFGKTAKQLCVERNVKKADLRNSHSEEELKSIADIENLAMKLIDNKDYEPLTAVKMAVELLT